MNLGQIGPRPRVLRAITRLNIGGPARQALLLTAALEEDFPTLLCAGQAPPFEGNLSHPDVQVHHVDLVRPLDPIRDLRSYRQLSQLMKQDAPQIVHTHMAKAGALGRLAALRAVSRPRLVHTFHGHVLDGYFRKGTQQAFVTIERQLARRTDALVAVSQQVADQLLELGIGSPERLHVIPLGFDLGPMLSVSEPSRALRRELGLNEDTPLLGIAARLTAIKDHVTLFQAMQRLPGVHLAVLGDGELRDTLVGEARQLGLSNRVYFTGWWSDMAAAYSDLHLAVLTSRNEGTPVALIEALAASVPVVSTDVGGVRSVVVHEETGLLVPAGDPAALASAIQSLLDNPARRRQMGEKGRLYVRDRFSHLRLIGDIRDLYRNLLANQVPR